MVSPSRTGSPAPCGLPFRHTEGFHVVDCSSFPFHELNDPTLVIELGRDLRSPYCYRRTRGNIIAAYVLAKHRIRVKASSFRWTNLEAVLDLPQELFLQILEWLHPIDLYNIIRTTKAFRSLLLSKSASKIWERCFLAYPEIPFYPKDVSAPKWASLLFATGICNGCGLDGHKTDFIFCERNCYRSRRVLCELYDPKLDTSLRQVTNQPDAVLNAIRPLLRSTPACYILEPRYSLEEIMEMTREVNPLLEAIASQVPGATESYSKWFEITAAKVSEQRAHTLVCESWAKGIEQMSEDEWKASAPAFCDWCEKILRKHNHDPRDIAFGRAKLEAFLQNTWDHYTMPTLRKKSLGPRLVPLLEKVIASAKSHRLCKEHEERVEKRRQLVIEFYTDTTQAHLKPNIAPYLPPTSSLLELPFFKTFANDPKDTVINVPVEIATNEIVHFVQSVIQDKKRFLIKLWAAANGNADMVSPEQLAQTDSPSVLDLATAVFECKCTSRNPYVMVGWEEIGVHKSSCGIKETKETSGGKSRILQLQFRYSTTARRVLEVLAKLIHVDLRYVRARDLDAMSTRFICKTCPFHRKATAWGLYSMDWRQCLTHTLESEKWPQYAECRIPKFDIASDALVESLQFVAQPYPSHGTGWSCNHCGEHLSDRVSRKEAVGHVKETHDIDQPEVDRDFFYYRTEQSPDRPSVFIGLDAKSNHRCLRCPEGRGLRGWVKANLFKHIQHIHGVEEPDLQEGVDWKKVKPVADETWVYDALRAQQLV